ncbi:MAG: hypothetical protein ACK6EB_29705, partial [Planctomyces sp.]
VVPYFNDKHLGWRWSDAETMVGTARRLGFPLLAGSSVPLAWRFPQLDLPQGCEIESALTVGYGPLEDYGFHALEAHQSMLERRRGGESGVSEVSVSGLDAEVLRLAGVIAGIMPQLQANEAEREGALRQLQKAEAAVDRLQGQVQSARQQLQQFTEEREREQLQL